MERYTQCTENTIQPGMKIKILIGEEPRHNVVPQMLEYNNNEYKVYQVKDFGYGKVFNVEKGGYRFDPLWAYVKNK